MSTDEVSIDTIPDAKTSFHIEGISYFFMRESRHPETLLHREEFIIRLCDMSERHTGSIVSDTLPLFQTLGEEILHSEESTISYKYPRLMFDNSRKHRIERLVRKSKQC